jgi:tetratricopeptide (TPR) repeat protein
MKIRLFSALTLLTALSLVAPVRAENLEHTQRLISTRDCQGCDLSRVGLIYADLIGANLSGANLSEANLTRANLSNANLSGADLRGAVLNAINLSGADLSGANLAGADLRDAYLEGVNLTGANLQGALLMGAVGLPEGVLTAADYYLWGMAEDRQGNFQAAIDYYSQAITLNPDFAHAYLARGVSHLQMYDDARALQDARRAEQLYLAQGNPTGHQTSIRFAEGIQQYQVARAEAQGEPGRPVDGVERRGRRRGGSFLGFLGGLANMALRFLPMLLVP